MRKILLFFILITSQLYQSQSDCISALPICGNSDIFYTPSGAGNVNEILATNGCLSSNERYSVWYTFTIATPGTLTFTIIPNVTATDYDFAVYGPTSNGCTSLHNNNVFVRPIRCNYSGTNGNTGLLSTLAPPANPATNYGNDDKWSPYMEVNAGETYYLIITNHSLTNNGFSMNWGGTATLSSAFSDPNLAPNPFIAPGTPNPAGGPNIITTCPLPGVFDFSTLTSGIVNNNANFTVTYHTSANDALSGSSPITAPINIDNATTYYYSIKYEDPVNPANPLNACRQSGSFKFILGEIAVQNATLLSCANNGSSTASFDLTTANVYSDLTAVKKYYLTMDDLLANVNEIQNVTNYVSTEKDIYVNITSSAGCTGNVKITLKFHPQVIVNEDTLEECYNVDDITKATFDLTTANVSTLTGGSKKFYPTLSNAISGTSEINNFTNYISSNSSIYVRVISDNGCYSITKINLKVISPVKSSLLKNKTICAEDRTTLDAGAGFDGYEWSTGATTQAIHGVPVGAYWVKLKTGKCYTIQEVNVYASNLPVISSLDIKNNSVTVNVIGGNSPYQYSLDGINWQDSNVFSGLSRGDHKFYVKDSYNCTPIQIQITVPNLVNAITPNGDNINDEIDYSALAYKKNLVFTVYNRYGNKIYEADKIRNYKWNGMSSGKKVQTGTYWYTITWNEDNASKTQIKYDGWVLVKNRE